MNLLVIGLSHHTAPLSVLEALSERPDRAEAIAASVLGSATATEAVVLSTCNRLEVYASVPAFHPAVAAIGEALALAAGIEEPSADPSGRRADAGRTGGCVRRPCRGARRPPLRPLRRRGRRPRLHGGLRARLDGRR